MLKDTGGAYYLVGKGFFGPTARQDVSLLDCYGPALDGDSNETVLKQRLHGHYVAFRIILTNLTATIEAQ